MAEIVRVKLTLEEVLLKGQEIDCIELEWYIERGELEERIIRMDSEDCRIWEKRMGAEYIGRVQLLEKI